MNDAHFQINAFSVNITQFRHIAGAFNVVCVAAAGKILSLKYLDVAILVCRSDPSSDRKLTTCCDGLIVLFQQFVNMICRSSR